MTLEEAKSLDRGTLFTNEAFPFSVWFDGDTYYKYASNIEVVPPAEGYVEVGTTPLAVLQNGRIYVLVKDLTPNEANVLRWDIADILEYLEKD